MLSGFILSPSFRILKRSCVREPHPFSHVRLFFLPADLCYIGPELTGIFGEVDLGASWGGMERYCRAVFKRLKLRLSGNAFLLAILSASREEGGVRIYGPSLIGGLSLQPNLYRHWIAKCMGICDDDYRKQSLGGFAASAS